MLRKILPLLSASCSVCGSIVMSAWYTPSVFGYQVMSDIGCFRKACVGRTNKSAYILDLTFPKNRVILTRAALCAGLVDASCRTESYVMRV